MEKWCLLGASRGLGKAFAIAAAKERSRALHLHLSARKLESLLQVKNEVEKSSVQCVVKNCDFTDETSASSVLEELKQWQPHRIFYFAGGGPYGEFESKQWKDHVWAYKLNLLFPARLLHASMNWSSVIQWVVIGSSVAESQPDPMASSYASAKHGLVGLISSLNKESTRDIRLFSPGYMDTDMLPKNASVRNTHPIAAVETVAQSLLRALQQQP